MYSSKLPVYTDPVPNPTYFGEQPTLLDNFRRKHRFCPIFASKIEFHVPKLHGSNRLCTLLLVMECRALAVPFVAHDRTTSAGVSAVSPCSKKNARKKNISNRKQDNAKRAYPYKSTRLAIAGHASACKCGLDATTAVAHY